MSDPELERIGRVMAGVLRHFPDRFGLQMDGHGWVDLRMFVESLKTARPQYRWLRTHHIVAIVETDPKGRYQADGGMVRATYAHSIDVNLDDLPEAATDELYFPCSEEEVDMILEQGLTPSDRKKIHLSGSVEKAVSAGKARIEQPIILAVDVKAAQAAGHAIRRAGKEVYVADKIDAKHVRRLENVDLTAFAADASSED